MSTLNSQEQEQIEALKSWWKENGSPTWDPITQQIKRDGVVIATFPTNNNLPTYFTTTWSERPNLFVDPDGLK